MFLHLEQILLSYAEHMHLTIFAPAVSFLEEIIPPIPSPSVMIATGSMASVQGYVFYSLFFLAFLGALGKTAGASVTYYVADKVEDLLSGKIARFLGVTHEQIEAFGARLGNGPRDYIILTVLRALPIMPSFLISVGSGLLKIRFRLFIISTFIGSFFRDFLYIYVGYIGTKVAISFLKETATTLETAIQILIVLAVILFFAYIYYRRGKKVV